MADTFHMAYKLPEKEGVSNLYGWSLNNVIDETRRVLEQGGEIIAIEREGD